MNVDWKTLKEFLDNTKLFHFVNYLTLENSYYVWINYQGQNFTTILNHGSVDAEEFENNYKALAVVKNTLSEDGVPFNRNTNVGSGRLLSAMFVKIRSCTDQNNDVTGNVKIYTLNSSGNITIEPTEAVKTVYEFNPNFAYEIYGGGIESLETYSEEFYISASIAPTIPEAMGGNRKLIINKYLKQPFEDIFRSGVGPSEVKYFPTMPDANMLRIELSHQAGVQKNFQIEIQYYS